MKIGMVGLGKLGLPVALAIQDRGHDVMGAEVSHVVRDNIARQRVPYQEPGAEALLRRDGFHLGTPSDIVDFADIIFVAVQTPHDPVFEGDKPLPEQRKDFDYSYLKEAVDHISLAATRLCKPTILVVISTVLPGTVRRELMPLLREQVELVYNPFFIAMGSTIRDFLEPEFVLLGSDSVAPADKVARFYATLHSRPVIRMGIEEAELTKVAYNTFITSKIVFANTLMEICERMGMNVDAVTDALGLATDRVISPKYLRGGMGDGGGCHPRDNIALSWLARELGLSYDLFAALMEARDRQAGWLAGLIEEEAQATGLPVTILGKAFKAATNITTGSPSTLVRSFLTIPARCYDPYIDGAWQPSGPQLWFIATNHPDFLHFPFPVGSVILDPWGYIPDTSGCRVRHIGRKEALMERARCPPSVLSKAT